MKKGRPAAAALAAVLLLSGCDRGSAVLPVATPTAPPTATPVARRVFALPYSPAGGFHPITGTDRVNLTLAPLLYQGLFSLDESFAAQKELCLDYAVSDDGLVWTFTLVETTFSDGSPLTPKEVASSLEKARNSDRFSTRLRGVKSVATRNDTVVVTLERPNGNLPALLDIPVVKESSDPLRPNGTGLYTLSGTDKVTLVARAGKAVPVQEIPLRPVTAGDDLIAAFDAGEASLVDTDLIGSNPLGYSGQFETTDYATTTLLYLGCNTAAASPCRDETVRRAVGLWGVPRERIVSELLAGHASATRQVFHPASPEWSADLERELALRESQSDQLLAETGWTTDDSGLWQRGGERLELLLLVNQDNAYKCAIADAVARALEEKGASVIVSRLPWESFTQALAKGQYDLYLGETALTADFDPEALVGTEGALNYGEFSDQALEEALEAWRAATGPERTALAGELSAALAQAAPVIPICFKNGSVLTSWGLVRGLRPTQRDLFNGFSDWRIAQ